MSSFKQFPYSVNTLHQKYDCSKTNFFFFFNATKNFLFCFALHPFKDGWRTKTHMMYGFLQCTMLHYQCALQDILCTKNTKKEKTSDMTNPSPLVILKKADIFFSKLHLKCSNLTPTLYISQQNSNKSKKKIFFKRKIKKR